MEHLFVRDGQGHYLDQINTLCKWALHPATWVDGLEDHPTEITYVGRDNNVLMYKEPAGELRASTPLSSYITSLDLARYAFEDLEQAQFILLSDGNHKCFIDKNNINNEFKSFISN